MKRFLVVLLLCMLVVPALAAGARLKKIYSGDYDSICRVVINLNRRVKPEVSQKANAVVVNLPGCTDNSFAKQALPATRVFAGYDLTKSDNGLTITLRTNAHKTYTLKELNSEGYKLVVDIFGFTPADNPSAYADNIDRARFMYMAEDNEEGFKIAEKKFPQYSGLYYWWGKCLEDKYPRYKKRAAKYYQLVKEDAPEYGQAYTALTGKPYTKAPTSSAGTATDQTSNPAAVAGTDSLATAFLASMVPELSENDSTRYLAGLVAQMEGKNEQAIYWFNKIADTSPLAVERNKKLYDLYTAMGLNAKADEVSARMPDELPSLLTGIRPIGVGFGAGIVLCLIIWLLSRLFRRKRQPVYEFENDDVSYHEKNIEKAYEEKHPLDEPAIPEPAYIPEPEMTETVEDVDMDFDNPPLVAPQITPEEEAELLASEETVVKAQAALVPEPPPLEEDEENEEENISIKDEKIKRRVVLKLAADGWEKKDIAKELKISLREVEFILKVMS